MVPPLQDGDNALASFLSDRKSTSVEKRNVKNQSTTFTTMTNSSTVAVANDDTMTKLSKSKKNSISFSHIQLYVKSTETLESYKTLEDQLNTFSSRMETTGDNFIQDNRLVWKKILAEATNTSSSNSSVGGGDVTIQPFVPQNRDIIKQLMVAFGMRVTGYYCNEASSSSSSSPSSQTIASTSSRPTTSYLVTTRDPNGIQIVVTTSTPKEEHASSENTTSLDVERLTENIDADSPTANNTSNSTNYYHHFDSTNLDRFFHCHNGRQGVAVLAFQVENVDIIHQRYQSLHPTLIHSFHEYQTNLTITNTTTTITSNSSDDDHNGDGSTSSSTTTKILEVYAYYEGTSDGTDTHEEEDHLPDLGTIIRFIEVDSFSSLSSTTATEDSDSSLCCCLPGLQRVAAQFDSSSSSSSPFNSSPCYFDHWVSNVYSRTEFLKTLHDTLEFDTKVDFNAGVVAAGEAQIESTVTGNESTLQTTDEAVALKDQTQVFLPINNALSPVGHVHGFLQEIGQGIQHCANRVENLIEFIERCNIYREITGEGFTTLRIPRSYYGVLNSPYLVESAGVSTELSVVIMETCAATMKVLSPDGAVSLDLTAEDLTHFLDASIRDDRYSKEYEMKKNSIIDTILNSRFCNIEKLLGNHLSKERYLGIVRNQILCDVQGDDVLFQIFTCNILQENAGDEAPFLEFIQRVCADCGNGENDESACSKPIKPGCGGFGIRNFLTLFLSIEVSKAMMDVSDAKMKGDTRRQTYAQKCVDTFTKQLNDSNPILTRISDAMTEEGRCLMELKHCEDGDDTMQQLESMLKAARKEKEEGNQALMECSQHYKMKMRELREQMG